MNKRQRKKAERKIKWIVFPQALRVTEENVVQFMEDLVNVLTEQMAISHDFAERYMRDRRLREVPT